MAARSDETPLDASLAGTQRFFDPLDNLLERVSSGTKTQLRAGNLARAGLTSDRDLGDLRSLEHPLDELAAVPIVGLREKKRLSR